MEGEILTRLIFRPNLGEEILMIAGAAVGLNGAADFGGFLAGVGSAFGERFSENMVKPTAVTGIGIITFNNAIAFGSIPSIAEHAIWHHEFSVVCSAMLVIAAISSVRSALAMIRGWDA